MIEELGGQTMTSLVKYSVANFNEFGTKTVYLNYAQLPIFMQTARQDNIPIVPAVRVQVSVQAPERGQSQFQQMPTVSILNSHQNSRMFLVDST